ncbi:MAG: methyl-accepting chemotaxis protein [Solirubrobacteraceae bacterium]|jgi:methyl-accepting chemotaxis protein
MRFFRDLSVRAKLFGGFAAVLMLTAVLGVVLIAQIGSVNAGGVYVGTNSMPSVRDTKQIGLDVTDYRRAQLQALIERSSRLITADLAQAHVDAAQITALLKDYGSMVSNATDARMLRAVAHDWSAYQSATTELNTMARDASLSVAAMAATSDQTQQAFLSLQQETNTWAGDNVQWGNQKLASDSSTYSTARTLGIGLLVLAIAGGMGIAFLVSRQIRGSVMAILERLDMLKVKGADQLSEGLKWLAEGDITHEFPITSSPMSDFPGDELGDIQRSTEELRDRVVASLLSYNETTQRLRDTIGRVAQTAESVGASSHQMAATSQEAGRATGEIAHAVGDVAHGAERQVRMSETARHAAEDVARAVTESAQQANQAAEVAHQTRQVAQQGVEAAAQANDAMQSVQDSSQAVNEAIRELAGKSDQIGQIVQTITGIAEQTNLLALNAAIEAARAGDQGRGFAVVAEEVRKLAEDSQNAAQEISVLIAAIQSDTTKAVGVVEDGAQRTQDGAAVVEKTRAAFELIETSVDDMTARIEHIAAASHQIAASAQSMQDSIAEVAAVAEQSSASTEEVSASTQETSASAEQIAASAQELSGNADTLNELVSQFKLND